MTRQKKEIIRRINELATDNEHASAGVHNQIYALQDQLVKLSHYENMEEMLMDNRRRF